ncbi:MAG: acyl-CoA thioesterase [Treponemataceae bacterium]|nr:MAG: acyl-CoA thioesterase [Treponemataceae bacterium]
MKKIVDAEIEFNVEFYDIDPMLVVWHGNYIKYFEKARNALLSKIGYGYSEMKKDNFAFPVTGVNVKYKKPFEWEDRVRARAILVEYENCLKIKYELYNAKTGELCTKGESTQMVLDMRTGETCFVCPQKLIDICTAAQSGAL